MPDYVEPLCLNGAKLGGINQVVSGHLVAERLRSESPESGRSASDTEHRAEFILQSGEIPFVNNRWLLRNRATFEDHPEPGRTRHLPRSWLTA